MFKHLILALMLLALGAAQTGAQESRVTLQEEFVYYEFEADPDSNVREAMLNASPIKALRGRSAGETLSKLQYRFGYIRSSIGCTIISIHINVKVKYTLPKWRNYKNANQPLKNEWDRFYAALLRHEKKHAKNRYDLARRIIDRYRYYREVNCSLAKKKFYDFSGHMWRTDPVDRDYDKLTRHGRTEGAYLAIPPKPLGLRIFDAIFERLPETLVRYLWLVFLLSVPLATFVAIRLTKRIFGLFRMRWA